MRYEYICERCGGQFTRFIERTQRHPHRFCSKNCRFPLREPVYRGDGTVLVPLTKGTFAIIDAEDAPSILRHRWALNGSGRGAWRSRQKGEPASPRHILMHREIMGLASSDEGEVDHINGNGLDNRRANLRPASRSQNAANRGMDPRNESGFRGVTWHRGKWRACITAQGRAIHLGYFTDTTAAAMAYDAAARLHFGPYARLNFPDAMKHSRS